jgi:hypothetical protein
MKHCLVRTTVLENDTGIFYLGVIFLELDHWALQLRKFDQEVQQLADLARIFDINVPEYKT